VLLVEAGLPVAAARAYRVADRIGVHASSTIECVGWHTLAQHAFAESHGVVVDTVRPRRELVLENAVLRHQVNVVRRRSKRPKLHFVDRLKLLLGARWLPSRRRAIVLVQLETVLRWHRAGFRRFWRR